MVSRKLSRSPRLQYRLLLRQLTQSGAASSHFRWRSLHVKQPVRTRLAFAIFLAVKACCFETVIRREGAVWSLAIVISEGRPVYMAHRASTHATLVPAACCPGQLRGHD